MNTHTLSTKVELKVIFILCVYSSFPLTVILYFAFETILLIYADMSVCVRNVARKSRGW